MYDNDLTNFDEEYLLEYNRVMETLINFGWVDVYTNIMGKIADKINDINKGINIINRVAWSFVCMYNVKPDVFSKNVT